MELRRLLDALHPRNFGQDFRQQPRFIEQFEAPAGRAFGQQFGQFVANALGGNLMDLAAPASRWPRTSPASIA